MHARQTQSKCLVFTREIILQTLPLSGGLVPISNTLVDGGGTDECSNSDYHTILLLFCSFEKYLKFENSLFLKLQDVTSVQAAPGSVSMSQYTVNPFPAAS